MAGLNFSFIIFLLMSYLGTSDSNESSFDSETASKNVEEPVLEPKKTDEALDGKNAISQLMSDSAFFSTDNILGEQIVQQKVLEIVKNPVNVDLNKLPSDVIEKIAEGGVTTPVVEAKPFNDNEKLEILTEKSSARTDETEEEEKPRTTVNPESEHWTHIWPFVVFLSSFLLILRTAY